MLKIAVVGKLDNGGFFGIRPDYVNYFGSFGAVSIVTPMTSEQWAAVSTQFNVVVLPGGADIDTTRYGAVPHMSTGAYDPCLEHFDKNLLATTLNRTLVVGICRGHQSLSVHMGLGSYFKQDLIGHEHSENWWDLAHRIDLYGQDRITSTKVNSLHHQGVILPRDQMTEIMAKRGLKVLATADTGIRSNVVLEAFEGNRCLGVQWHPEVLNDPLVKQWIMLKLSQGWIIKD